MVHTQMPRIWIRRKRNPDQSGQLIEATRSNCQPVAMRHFSDPIVKSQQRQENRRAIIGYPCRSVFEAADAFCNTVGPWDVTTALTHMGAAPRRSSQFGVVNASERRAAMAEDPQFNTGSIPLMQPAASGRPSKPRRFAGAPWVPSSRVIARARLLWRVCKYGSVVRWMPVANSGSAVPTHQRVEYESPTSRHSTPGSSADSNQQRCGTHGDTF